MLMLPALTDAVQRRENLCATSNTSQFANLPIEPSVQNIAFETRWLLVPPQRRTPSHGSIRSITPELGRSRRFAGRSLGSPGEIWSGSHAWSRMGRARKRSGAGPRRPPKDGHAEACRGGQRQQHPSWPREPTAVSRRRLRPGGTSAGDSARRPRLPRASREGISNRAGDSGRSPGPTGRTSLHGREKGGSGRRLFGRPFTSTHALAAAESPPHARFPPSGAGPAGPYPFLQLLVRGRLLRLVQVDVEDARHGPGGRWEERRGGAAAALPACATTRGAERATAASSWGLRANRQRRHDGLPGPPLSRRLRAPSSGVTAQAQSAAAAATKGGDVRHPPTPSLVPSRALTRTRGALARLRQSERELLSVGLASISCY